MTVIFYYLLINLYDNNFIISWPAALPITTLLRRIGSYNKLRKNETVIQTL